MKNIVLIGIMGCGKTTISKLLSERLNRPMIDLDEYLVNKYKMTIPEMFDIFTIQPNIIPFYHRSFHEKRPKAHTPLVFFMLFLLQRKAHPNELCLYFLIHLFHITNFYLQI